MRIFKNKYSVDPLMIAGLSILFVIREGLEVFWCKTATVVILVGLERSDKGENQSKKNVTYTFQLLI